MPRVVAGLRGLGAHELGGERGSVLTRMPEAPVELVAEPFRIVHRQCDEGRRHVARPCPGTRYGSAAVRPRASSSNRSCSSGRLAGYGCGRSWQCSVRGGGARGRRAGGACPGRWRAESTVRRPTPAGGRKAGNRYQVCGSGRGRPAFEDAVEHLGTESEGPGAPGHDLHPAADAFHRGDVGVGRSLDLDSVDAHDASARTANR